MSNRRERGSLQAFREIASAKRRLAMTALTKLITQAISLDQKEILGAITNQEFLKPQSTPSSQRKKKRVIFHNISVDFQTVAQFQLVHFGA